jgi:hypothetical protein
MIGETTNGLGVQALALGAFVAGTVLLGATSARAGSDGVTGEEVLAALRNADIRATLNAGPYDDPEISASARGTDFQVKFYGCDAGVCASFMYSAEYIVDSAPSLE